MQRITKLPFGAKGGGKQGGEGLWNDDPGCQRPPKHEQAASIERNRAKTCKKTRRRTRFVHVVEFVALADPKYMKPPLLPQSSRGSGARAGPFLSSNSTLASCFPCTCRIKIKIKMSIWGYCPSRATGRNVAPVSHWKGDLVSLNTTESWSGAVLPLVVREVFRGSVLHNPGERGIGRCDGRGRNSPREGLREGDQVSSSEWTWKVPCKSPE